jgi:hypothetical protein
MPIASSVSTRNSERLTSASPAWPVSPPKGYREIIDNVVDNCIEIDRRQVPIIPENASVIRGFVRACRERRAGPKSASPLIPDLELGRPNLPVGLVSYLKGTAYTALREWDRIARRLEEMNPHNR